MKEKGEDKINCELKEEETKRDEQKEKKIDRWKERYCCADIGA